MADDYNEILRRYEERTAAQEQVATTGIQDTPESGSELDDYLLYDDMPVALVKSEGVDYVACMISEDYVAFPLLYREILSSVYTEEQFSLMTPAERVKAEKEGMNLQIVLDTVHLAGFLMSEVHMTLSFAYLLKNTQQGDTKLFNLYKGVLTELRMSHSGLVKPSTEDLIKLNSGK